MFDELQHLLTSLARGLKYFCNVELLYPSDEFQTNLMFSTEHRKQKHQFYRVAHTIKVIFFFSLLKIQFVWNSSDAFAVSLPQQRPVLVPAHAENFFSWSSATKILQGNANCSAPKTVIGVTKAANERYFPYVQLCEKAFLWIFIYCRCKSGSKLGENNENWGLLRTQTNNFLQNIL